MSDRRLLARENLHQQRIANILTKRSVLYRRERSIVGDLVEILLIVGLGATTLLVLTTKASHRSGLVLVAGLIVVCALAIVVVVSVGVCAVKPETREESKSTSA